MQEILENGATIRLLKQSREEEDGKLQPSQVGFDFDGERGLNNGIVFQVDKDKPVDDVSRGKGIAYTYPPAGSRPTLPTLNTEEPTPNVSAVAPLTTTEPRDIGDIIAPGKQLDFCS
ncbi:unnamed protein product [Strongylus vulgaris]|uniref:Uncharacterized protein n=1 Tax=Strongylus vulgaris TaxID=40348 RepID=A0A3P7IV99_STRVU|nr:unnamed protein product [Strongylus vulgaris]